MQREAEEQNVSQPNYHLTHRAIEQIMEIARTQSEELAHQLLSDLDKVGNNPLLGIELDQEEAAAVHGDPLSQAELDRVKASRLYHGDVCSVYWSVETLESNDSYSAIWSINLREEGEDNPIAVVDKLSDWLDETNKREQEKPPE